MGYLKLILERIKSEFLRHWCGLGTPQVMLTSSQGLELLRQNIAGATPYLLLNKLAYNPIKRGFKLVQTWCNLYF